VSWSFADEDLSAKNIGDPIAAAERSRGGARKSRFPYASKTAHRSTAFRRCSTLSTIVRNTWRGARRQNRGSTFQDDTCESGSNRACSYCKQITV